MSVTPKLYTEKLVKVYVARGGKKYFQREAARRRGAWDLIKERCTCHWSELDDPEEGGKPNPNAVTGFIRCRYHQEFICDDSGRNVRPHRGLRLHAKLVARSKRQEQESHR